MMHNLVLSKLGHTWILDLDGTVLKHNGYLIDGKDTLFPQAKDFIDSIPEKDMIIFLTSRKEEFRSITEEFLKEQEIRCDHIVFDVPYGERILINDRKPSGLQTAYSINPDRDKWEKINVIEDDNR